MKLVVAEPGSGVLVELLRAWPDRISSALALAEVPRALRRAGFGDAERRRARQVLASISLVGIDHSILAAAAALEPPTLRTLDAIHLATALAVPEELVSVVSYDVRLSGAARRVRLAVLAPA